MYWWYFLWRAISGGPWPEPKDCWDAAPGRRRRVPRMFREIPNIMATTCNHQQDRKVKSYQSNHKSNCSKFLTIGNANMCVFFKQSQYWQLQVSSNCSVRPTHRSKAFTQVLLVNELEHLIWMGVLIGQESINSDVQKDPTDIISSYPIHGCYPMKSHQVFT